ncbi:MAG: hypothetical protein Q9162_007396 [Coniocarpon cinnabarinum]
MATAVQTPTGVPTLDKVPLVSTVAYRRDSDELPPGSLLQQCEDHWIYDKDGNSLTFGSLYNNRRCMVIFVRHFFCGICQDYLRNLVASISTETLASAQPATSLVVIGCGQPELIGDYAAKSNCTFPIYADPSRRLYDLLGMDTSFDRGSRRPDYQTTTFSAIVIKSLLQGITAGRQALKGGNFAQMGGEFLFENNQVVWCYKMKNTRDHTEIEDLKGIMGV